MEKQSKPELDFKDGNPGAVQFGNFINYYQFHPPEQRLKLLPLDLWKDKLDFYGLDIGCNCGRLTMELYNALKSNKNNCNMLGIDIDPNLVERSTELIPPSNDIEFACMDFMNETDRFAVFPPYLTRRNLNRFSAVFCFSLTMWIHLNHGDAGLQTFLKTVCNLGECIVIEPQPWKCYKSAVKRMKLSSSEFPHYKQLKWRESIENDIEEYLLTECKMRKVYESNRTEWGRKLIILQHCA